MKQKCIVWGKIGKLIRKTKVLVNFKLSALS